ncbi:MAG: hypothetical protein AB7P49_05560 [Bdellovibrionales bacterium]
MGVIAPTLGEVQSSSTEAVSSPMVRHVSSSPVELPLCIEERDVIDSIKATIAANRETKFKYDGYRKALAKDTDTWLLARLVYAETLAANCPSLAEDVSSRIAAAIVNRVRIRRGDIRGVVYQLDQFSSSLNIYAESRYRDFLCPKNLRLWQQVVIHTRAALASGSNDRSPYTVHYFLYKHSPQWTKEPWQYPEDQKNTTPQLRECVKFFRNPTWR